MVCVYERNLDLVRSRRKTSDDERPAAGFGPDPRRAIDRDMEISFRLVVKTPAKALGLTIPSHSYCARM